jgi:hypothetical protein
VVTLYTLRWWSFREVAASAGSLSTNPALREKALDGPVMGEMREPYIAV